MIVSKTWPPTVNHIWKPIKSRLVLSNAGKKYYENAPWEILALIQMESGTTRKRVYAGPVRVVLDFWPPDRRSFDVDNRAKPVLDALVKARVLENDDLVYELLLRKHPYTKTKPGHVGIDICPLQNDLTQTRAGPGI